MPAKLRIHFANGTVETRTFQEGQYRIGREAGELVLGDPNVSSNHAILTVDAGSVIITDIGSTNGTFEMSGQRLTAPLRLASGHWVKLGASTLVVEEVSAPGGTQVMQQIPAQAPPAQAPYLQPAPQQPYAAPQQPYVAPQQPYVAPQQPYVAPQQPYVAPQQPYAAPLAAAIQPYGGASPTASATGPSPHSHPDQPVRHTYPLHIDGFGISSAVALLMKTAPFLGARLGVLFGVSMVGLVYWIVCIAMALFLGHLAPLVGWVFLIFALGAGGWFWRGVVRYFLYLLKAGHIAVLTELITKGQVGNGSEGMFSYGKRIVKERFGEVTVLFAIDAIVKGVVNAINGMLDFITGLLPVPGLDSITGFVKALLRASTTYIDETIFSYNLARGDENVFRSSKDGLIYYAQNSKEILKTAVWVVLLEKVLSVITFWIIFMPALFIVSLFPSGGWGIFVQLTAIIIALMFTYDVQQAVLRPLFLTMIMLKYHAVVQNQAINPEWDQRLDGVSDKFRELKGKASEWLSPNKPALPAGAQPHPVAG